MDEITCCRYEDFVKALAEILQVRYGGSGRHVSRRPFVSFPVGSRRGVGSMSGQRPLDRGQSPCCGGDWRVKQIQIGGVTVGIVGLTEVLEQVYRLGRRPGPETAEELLAMVKTQNWVERNSEQDYREALLREYTAYWEAKAGADRQGEKGR